MMKQVAYLGAVCFLAVMSTACQRSSDDVWNDTKTAGRHFGRGVDSIGGKHGGSRQIQDGPEAGGSSQKQNDFVPLDDQLDLQVTDPENLPPSESPGESGSSIPGIEAFKDPAQDPQLAPIFEHIHFDYNSSLVKGDDNLKVVRNICDYMKGHPNLYVFVEGHCDKRGSAAYNLALGANRANAVRSMLIQDGISGDRLFTISYGKERPLFDEEGEEFHRLNRRDQFKVYEK
jgi:peptidoglycan-associated lipoprotein